MILLRDDPIIACIERTGYAPWMQDDDEEEEDEDDEWND